MVNFGCDKCVILPAGDTFLFYFGFVYDFWFDQIYFGVNIRIWYILLCNKRFFFLITIEIIK